MSAPQPLLEPRVTPWRTPPDATFLLMIRSRGGLNPEELEVVRKWLTWFDEPADDRARA